MIDKPIVFILGAGASMPYGLLSGPQLRAEICAAADGSPSHVLNILLEQKLGISRFEVQKFAAAFRGSARLSIDAFLSQRKEFVDIGKLCIAVELCRREDPSAILRASDDNWYELLWDAMTRDGATLSDVRNSRIHVVTFNYDRSLEQFLFEATKNAFGVSDEDALSTVRSMNINHVYGCLGEFGVAFTERARPYSTDVSKGSLEIAAKGLRIIPEARDDDNAFHHARDAIARCEKLCVLGFGFDFLNLERLKARAALEHLRNKPDIVASTFGKTNAEVMAYRHRICTPDNPWRVYSTMNAMTIRESGVLLY